MKYGAIWSASNISSLTVILSLPQSADCMSPFRCSPMSAHSSNNSCGFSGAGLFVGWNSMAPYPFVTMIPLWCVLLICAVTVTASIVHLLFISVLSFSKVEIRGGTTPPRVILVHCGTLQPVTKTKSIPEFQCEFIGAAAAGFVTI